MKKIILILAVMFLSADIFAQSTTSEARLTTEGKSSVKLIPEELWFTVNLTVKDNNYSQCADMAVKKMNNIKKLFVNNGIDEKLIKAKSYSIREVTKYDREHRKSVPDGYKATIPITIRTKKNYPKNDLIFDLIKDNLEANFSLYFSLSDGQTQAVKEKLVTLAVEDARQKAKIIAQSAGLKLGKIKDIKYGEPSLIRGNPQPDLRQSLKMFETTDAAKGITDALSPDEVEMRTSIIIAWEIEK